MSDVKLIDVILQEQSSETANNVVGNGYKSAVKVLSTSNLSTCNRHMRFRSHHLVDCAAKQQLLIPTCMY